MQPHTDPTDRIARRPFLAAAGTAGIAALAGCLDGLGTTTLDWTGEQVDADGRERHHLFGPGRDVTFSLRQVALAGPETDPKPVPFEATLHHREGLRTEHLRLRLLAPPRDGSVFVAPIAVESPDTHRTTGTVSRDRDGWTILELGPTEGVHAGTAFGRANVAARFFVHPSRSHPVDDLFVEVDARLAGDGPFGRRYSCRRNSVFPIVGAVGG